MKVLQTPFTENHKSAMFFNGIIAISDDNKYILGTFQDGEIGYEEKTYIGADTIELAKLDEVFDNDIEDERIVEIYIDKFITIKDIYDNVISDEMMFDNYDEAISEFKKFLIKKDDKNLNDGAILIPVLEDLKDIDWTEEQKVMITSLINNLGSGQHPVCDTQTFNYFKIDYLKEILGSDKLKAKSEYLSIMGLDIVDAIKHKLDI